MAKIDVPIKRLMQSRIEDWIKYLIPDCNKDWIIEIDADKVPAKKESRLDKLILIDSPNERYMINIEPQGYLDYKMPARMLRYRSDIWEYTLDKGMGTPSIKQVAVYFYKEHDNKNHKLEDSWNNEETLKFSYKVIRVWEMEKEPIISKKLMGLYPMLPLMSKSQYETDDDVLQNTVNAINTVDNKELQADLFAVMSILAEEKFTKELVKKYIRRDMLMNSPLFNEWVEEERKEIAERVAKETTKEAARKYIVELLSEKFDFVSKEIRDNIASIDDIVVLDELHKKIIKIDSIESFQTLLEKATKIC